MLGDGEGKIERSGSLWEFYYCEFGGKLVGGDYVMLLFYFLKVYCIVIIEDKVIYEVDVF